MSRLPGLKAMLARGMDSALLRFSLGNEYLGAGQPAAAVEHFQAAITLDASYSAAWKLLGRALSESGDDKGAVTAWERGIAAAQAAGDVQAGKEMQVFLRRAVKRIAGEGEA